MEDENKSEVKAREKGDKVSDDTQIEAVKNSFSIAGVLRYLGKPVTGGQHVWAKRRILKAGIDTSHFTGQGWNAGSIQYCTDEVFAEGSTRKRMTVRRYIIRDHLIPYKCAFCGNTGEWMGKPMALELDHINGVPNDHRLENLRFLCPNCHATTDTYCGKNKTHHKEQKGKELRPFHYKPVPENAVDDYHYSQQKKCPVCGVLISNSATTCRECYKQAMRKTNTHEMPGIDLAKLVVDNGIAGVAKLYGVSESTVVRWCVEHGLPGHKAEIMEWYNQHKDDG